MRWASRLTSRKILGFASWRSMLTDGKVGGFAWWKSVGLIFTGLIMDWGMSLRYGDPSYAWLTVLVVFVFSLCLLWWSHVQTRDNGQTEKTNEEQGGPTVQR